MTSDPEALPPGLITAVDAQSAVIFLGAGASYGASHPDNQAIPNADRLRDRLSDRFLAGQLKNRPLHAVADYAANETSLIAVQQFIRDLFQPFAPADFHRLIPQFRWHGIVTTNYDLVIERSYTSSSEPLQELVPFVKNGQNVETSMKKAVNGVQYLKLHGCIDHYLDRDIPFILDSEQYARYSKNRTRLLDRFRDWGTEFPIIFCGYSMSDPHIQALLFDLFDMQRQRQMYYVVDPEIDPIEARYLASRRITPIKATMKEFLILLNNSVPTISRSLPRSIGGGTSTLRRHYKVVNAPESDGLFQFLSDDVDHVRSGIPVAAIDPKDFYRGLDTGWGGIEKNLDVSRSITDSLVIDAILSSDEERPAKVDLYAVKGPGGNGKTIVLKRTAWMAAHDYDKIVLFVKMGGAIREEVLEEIYRYTQQRIFLFIDKAALYVEDIRRVVEFAKSNDIALTIVAAERDGEWNVRCESLEKYTVREFPVRYLSEREIRALLQLLESHDSLGLLKELPHFEDRVKRLVAGAQRQLLVALHEATLGKAFEDIVFEEYHRIIPNEAQALYLDICTLYRLGVSVRAGLVSRTSGINFIDFERRLFKPLEHLVRSHYDKYIGDYVYAARHQHVAEMVFERVLAEPDRRYDQIVRIMGGMNLDYSSDKSAFSQLVRGHWVAEALRSRELGRAFFDAATKVAPNEAFLLQQRGIYEMEHGGDLSLAQTYLDRAYSLEHHNRPIQHSLAVLARRQALATTNFLQRQRYRDKARDLVMPLLGTNAETAYDYHTAAQITLDELRDRLDFLDTDPSDQMAERRIVELARDFERFAQEGLQKFPLNSRLLDLESQYRLVVDQHGRAEIALRKAFQANPRQDWIAIRLARTLAGSAKWEEAKDVLLRCLDENPTSRRGHFELALLYMRDRTPNTAEFIFEHLRRSFVSGDQNYEAQFWYAREAF